MRPGGERRRSDHLLEVTALQDPDDARRLAKLVRTRLVKRGEQVANALYEAVAELGINVHDHAQPAVNLHPATGYVAAQTMPRSQEVVFAVADAGVGMLGTLRSRGAEDDRQAISLALGGTSRFAGLADRGRGLGDISTLVASLGGSLYVASGWASTTCHPHGVRRSRRLTAPYVGTLLQARVPLG